MSGSHTRTHVMPFACGPPSVVAIWENSTLLPPFSPVLSISSTAATWIHAASHRPLYPTGRSTYADPARGGGHLFTQITHAASVVLWVVGRSAARVSALECHNGFAVDLADSVAVTFDDGSLAAIAGTGSIHEHSSRVEEYRFFGSNGHALLNTASGTLDISLLKGPLEVEPLSRDELDLSWRTSAALVATALGTHDVVVPGELGAAAVNLLWAAESSRNNGSPIGVGPF